VTEHSHTQPSVEDDLRVIVGGSFNPAALGPPPYEEILGRLRANPDAYLDAAEQQFLGSNFDADLQSRLHLPYLLQLVADLRPGRVRELAEQLLRQYDSVLVIHDAAADPHALATVLPDETMSLLHRLDDRRRALQELLA
jgi:hypothetical protein